MAPRKKPQGRRVQEGAAEGGSGPPGRPGQRRHLDRPQSRAARNELEGVPKACRTQDRVGWGLGEDGQEQGQGQMVLPQAPAAQGVPAGLELQASPVSREQREVTEVAPPSSSQAGKTPLQAATQEACSCHRTVRTHLHTFWAVVPRGADVSGESLGGGREQGSPMGTVKRSAKSISPGGAHLGFHPTLHGRDPGQHSSLP